MRAGRRSKYRLMALFIGCLMMILAVRLFVLTVPEGDRWASYADDMTKRMVYETAPRGDIVDRNGRKLAASRAVHSIVMNRVGLDEAAALRSADHVISLLKERGESVSMTQDNLRKTLESGGYDSYLPLTLAEDVSVETAEAVQEAEISGVQVSTRYIREYPEGALAAHVLGYLGKISEGEKEEYVDEKGYRVDALIGKSGIEKLCEDTLKGRDAVSTLQVDSRGNVTKLLDETEPEQGQDVGLTIDVELQKTTEEALQQAVEQAAAGGVFQSRYGDRSMVYAKNAAVGAAVALDVETGQVLALASYPDFDPNDFAEGISPEKWEALQTENENDPLSPSPMYNVATMSAVQPGSTFKPVTALAALSCGLNEDQALYDAGAVTLSGISYGCHLWNSSRASHGYVDLREAVKASCNYYFYDIAAGKDLASGVSLGYSTRIGNDTISDFAKMMNLGLETGIELEESAGIIPSEDRKVQGLKDSLYAYLLAEQETYFRKSLLDDRKRTRWYIQKIVNWADKDLTFEEIIGKLKQKNFVKEGKITELANICKYTYFDQMKWTLGDTFNISIGQGDNAYTVLQMAAYMAVLGNDGVRNRIHIIADKAADLPEEAAVIAKVDQEDIDSVLDAMTGVAMEPGGSLYSVFGSFPYEVAGKTGTAQRAGKISHLDEEEYLRRYLHLIDPKLRFDDVRVEAMRLMEEYPDVFKTERTALRRAVINLSGNGVDAEDIDRYKESYDNFAWTVALAPADDPEIAVAVMLVQGKAASNAAPVVREIIGKYGEISKWDKSY